jgi:hypothetical protein
MLAISRALMASPDLILLDEPSLGLSPKLTQEIFEIVVRINRERGTTILLVEQNANMALNAADYGYVLETGRIVMEDTCARLREKDDIKEFYLGLKERRRARRAALEENEDVAMRRRRAAISGHSTRLTRLRTVVIAGRTHSRAIFWNARHGAWRDQRLDARRNSVSGAAGPGPDTPRQVRSRSACGLLGLVFAQRAMRHPILSEHGDRMGAGRPGSSVRPAASLERHLPHRLSRRRCSTCVKTPIPSRAVRRGR